MMELSFLLDHLILFVLACLMFFIILVIFLEHLHGDQLMAMVSCLLLTVNIFMGLQTYNGVYLLMAAVLSVFLYGFMRKKNPWGNFKGIPFVERILVKLEKKEAEMENKEQQEQPKGKKRRPKRS